MKTNRRKFLQTSLGAGVLALSPRTADAAPLDTSPILRPEVVSKSPVKIASIELLQHGTPRITPPASPTACGTPWSAARLPPCR